MTKKQRADVVELLRCCADLHYTELYPSVWMAQRHLGASETVYGLAYEAVWAGPLHAHALWPLLLEAAARVEEGSWP